MDWLPTVLDHAAFPAWCILTSEVGKPVMGLVGLGGIISIFRTLYALPIPCSEIITDRNRKRRYRRRTVALGWLTVVCLVASVGTYWCATSSLRNFGKVCEMDSPPHGAAIAVIPFLVMAAIGLAFLGWFHARATKVKSL